MKKSIARAGIVVGAALAVVGIAGGVASATPVNPAAGTSASASAAAAGAPSDIPIWLLPGVDAGALLDPVIAVPTTVLAPIDSLLLTLYG
jgi:hypothetical protein